MLTNWARPSATFVATTGRRMFSEVSHRPVIDLSGIHARYANATYVAASKAGKLDVVESELNGLSSAATKSASFAQFLQNPLIGRDDKEKVVNSMGDKLSPTTKNLLVTLAGNARLAELPKIASTYAQLMKAKRGEVDVKITSAEKLSDQQLKSIQDALKSQVPTGKSIVLQTVVDGSIVGGLQVQIGDQFLDLSIKNRVDEIARMPLN